MASNSLDINVLNQLPNSGRFLDESARVQNLADLIRKYNAAAWTERGSADNATAIATRAAESGKTHYVTALTGSYGNSKSGLLTIKDGSTAIYEFFVYDTDHIEFPMPIPMTKGNAASVELAASETGGTIGYVNMQGITL